MFKHVNFKCLSLAFSARWIKPIREPILNNVFSNAMALQDIPGLEGAALEFAESRGFGPLPVDSNVWTLLHHAASESQDSRGMFDVIRGLLQVMPIDLVGQTTNGGTPLGWADLSLLSNARDAANVRAEIARLLVEKRADLEVRSPHGTAPLMNACACGNWSCVRVLLDAHANPHATNIIGRNASDVAPRGQTMAVRASKGSHRC